ncbi:MAG: 2-oxoacid:ferredoxin oxidoreductase subunit gamma [Lachnospiraceae bacterium]|nr:2-oxoacid:ferredoxin oxidoreductase subunit gamma [Lachnospiraceae bacterium]
MTREYLFAGFGGQGLLFSGKVLAYKGLIEDKNVSWLPSYGPEMRGGTANCSVIVSDEPVGAPIISNPDVLVAMNLPSLDKYEPLVKKGGTILVDSSLIERKVTRDDVNVYYIPATKLAGENGAPTLANMILVGKMLNVFDEYDAERVRTALGKCVSARHADLLELNLKAMEIGRDYE